MPRRRFSRSGELSRSRAPPLLTALHLAQAEVGYLPRAVRRRGRRRCSASCRSRCRKSSPSTRCSTPSRSAAATSRCAPTSPAHSAGARKLVRQLERQLDIRDGEVTADGKFSIAEVAVPRARAAPRPCVQVNNQPYHRARDREQIDRLLKTDDPADWAGEAPQVSMIPDGVEGYLLPPERPVAPCDRRVPRGRRLRRPRRRRGAR